ncbi:MAG: lamin tail domain-containing protein, partial [Bacteroidota bacterium]
NSNNSPGVDHEPPVMLYYGCGESGELFLHYSEPLGTADLDREDFLLRPGSVFPLEVLLSQPLATRLKLRFQEDLQERQQYRLELPILSDCQGNASQKEILRGGKILPPAYGAIIINEIMYDPLDGFPEFIELYNPGPGYLDLQDLAIQLTETGAPPDHPLGLSKQSRICLPGQFLVLTACAPWLEEAYGLYPSGSWVELEAMPGMKNTGATVYLTDRSGSLVDQASYSDHMHMDLLNDTKGISLERISVDRPGSEPGNWHSAASISGYATPGEENSQALDQFAANEVLEVDPAVFSPDNDGFQDLLKISISTGAQSWVISLWISDLSGVMVRQLANNHIAGPSALYSWDGENKDGHMVSAGFYVVHFRAYHPVSGEEWRKRRAIGLMYR